MSLSNISPARVDCAPRLSSAALAATLLVLVPVLAFAPVAAAAAAAADAASAAGRWEGAIELPGSELAVTVDLARDDDGAWRGDVDIPAQGARDLPLTAIEAADGNVRFTLAGVPGAPTFAGELSADGAELAGDFTQGGQTFPFHLARSAAAAEVAPALDPAAALEGLDDWMGEQLEGWNVPAAAVAVVHDGEVVLTAGYGRRDVEADLPADADTLFAIGSASKAFTATVLATLAEEGKVDWDEPVHTYLPDFELADEYATLHLTLRDLVSHVSGLPRHDLMWYGSPLSRHELYERLRYLEPSEELRQRFQYQNLMFMTAGILAGEVAGSSWEELVERRLFAPLGMKRSSVRLSGLTADADAARGYREKPDDEADEADGADEAAGGEQAPRPLEVMPYRDIDAVGPAGSVSSSARDMARWLLLQLGDGEVDGQRVLAATSLRTLHRPHVVVEGGIESALFQQPEMPYLMYGLGWFVQPYRGHEMVHHGGNIDGFSARVTFFPRDGLGIVVLSNRNGTLLPTVVTLHLADRFLGLDAIDWSSRYHAIADSLEGARDGIEASQEVERQEGTSPSHPLADYAATYSHPAYGDLTVSLGEDGRLAVSFHALDSPLEHWHYDVFNATEAPLRGVKLTFDLDAGGAIDRVRVPLEGTVEAIEFTRQAAAELSSPEVLAEYVGVYEVLGAPVTVELRDDATLTVTVAGQPTYSLAAVRRDRFAFADQEGYGVLFQRGDDGAVNGLVFLQPQGNVPAQRRTPDDDGNGMEKTPQGEAARQAA